MKYNEDEKPKWNPILVDPKGIKITYREKYGEEKEGLWESDTEYLLTWLDSQSMKLEKANINSIKYKKER
jgi:hypothetical protein